MFSDGFASSSGEGSLGTHCKPELSQTLAALSMGLEPNGLRLELQGSGQEGGTGITLQLANNTNRMNLAVGKCLAFPNILHLDLSETWGPGGAVTLVGRPWSHSRVVASGVRQSPRIFTNACSRYWYGGYGEALTPHRRGMMLTGILLRTVAGTYWSWG